MYEIRRLLLSCQPRLEAISQISANVRFLANPGGWRIAKQIEDNEPWLLLRLSDLPASANLHDTGLARASPLQSGKYRTYVVTRSSNHLFGCSHKEGLRFWLGMEVP